MIHLYTDGACRGNPGKGGAAAVLIYGDKRKEISKGYKFTTNNRMEIMSVILGLNELKRFDIPITIYSDSKYVCNPFNLEWMSKWIQKDFKDIKNVDLWRELMQLLSNFKDVNFVWVKGHASNVENNRCDILAVNAALTKELSDDVGYKK